MKAADLNWQQFREIPRDRIALVPLGSHEQHSTHLPFSTDVKILDALVNEIEAQIGDLVLSLPTFSIAHSARHLPFGGTVSLSEEAYTQAVLSLATSLIQAGFGRILLLNGQLDAEPMIDLALRRLRQSHPGTAVITVSYWDALENATNPGHAGELETSLLLHLHPKLVDGAAIARDEMSYASRYTSRIREYPRMDQRTHHGGIGNPETATAEKGERLFAEISHHLIALIQDYRNGVLTL